jgi:predicted MFS family arabinose efflux permease
MACSPFEKKLFPIIQYPACTRPPNIVAMDTRRTAWIALAGLAAAMGIGRFAFTPLLPLMQAEGLTLPQGAALASANYLGYLLGALACAALAPPPATAARWGLLAVALATLAMPWATSPAAGLLLRGGAGVASAYVLVGVSAWALNRRAPAGQVYAGVGVGMVVAGGVALAVGLAGGSADSGWWLLGGVAAAVFAWAGPALRHDDVRAARPADVEPPRLRRGSAIALVACYGAFGFGYIVPATFLPAMARELVGDPAVFGWTWPVFGLAAAVSTSLAGRLAHALSPRALWAASQVVMALGVLLPAVAPRSLAALVASAVCVGGTFMVATMAGLQEARRVAGPGAARLMAAMTAAFGAGQFIGPLLLAVLPAASLSAIAAVLLLASSAALLLRPETSPRFDPLKGPP